MQITKLSAPLIFKGDDTLLNDKVIVLDHLGNIVSIDDLIDHDKSSIYFAEKAICPGFINTHCHLELSHMKGLVDTGTSLIPFIKHVVTYRDFPKEVIMQAISDGDNYMYAHGISAVGDISNNIDSNDTKEKSHLNYYTFVEMFDLMNPHLTLNSIQQYRSVFDAFPANSKNKKSLVPHAPYSVTKDLFTYIRNENEDGSTISIHNQETPSENELFQTKTGGFTELFREFGNDLKHFELMSCNSIEYAIHNMNAKFPTLFVHNTLTTKKDIELTNQWNKNIFWASCPNANLYIENKLPDYKNFIETNQKMTIGTDSLTSNWQLSIFEEMKTINKYCSYIPFNTLVKWACKNGAEALNFNHLGSIEVGKRPGFVEIPVTLENDKFIVHSGNEKRIV